MGNRLWISTRVGLCGAIAAVLASPALLAQQAPADPAARPVAQAHVALAPYRYGDLLWENDRTAHRLYSHELEAAEPPSSSGIDAWGKSVRSPFMERQLKGGDYHANQGEGLDFYNVHTGRGAGGLGIWHDNKLWTSRNFVRARITRNGPDVAAFSVDYAPWPVGVGRSVSETRDFALPMGSNFTRMVSTIRSNQPGPLVVGIGISKRATDATKLGTLSVDRKAGKLVWWGPTDPAKGTMGIALMVDPAAIVDVTADYENYLVLLKVTPGKPFVYYMGAAWDRGLDFPDRAAWQRYVGAQTPDFAPGRVQAGGAR